ncbi:HD domain-containing protein [Oceanirhabdus sp. W0125-5]|uniref:HD domain-containing protein n=1 Tax=Oceanirhabdus sp. W0125-5 TaxID=2999116 RepID=UPI0022F2B0E0|nr:HD domain-containing protein [Oceanirhabdus sp. W0125-5]WBW97881.1 HD domain-containing protein [Oceanirhabdus sp. W0125-5]
MNLLIETFSSFKHTDNFIDDCYNFLKNRDRTIVAEHSIKVSDECARLANIFGYSAEDARIAGILHDISAVFPYTTQLEIVKNYGIELLPVEETFPLLVHQKTSRVIAEKIFNINDMNILKAIECHTTLKENPSTLELILFIADKLCWDKPFAAPYYELVSHALEISLEYAAYVYMKYTLDEDLLNIIHPWYQQAYDQLTVECAFHENMEGDKFEQSISQHINRKHKRNRF